MKINVINNLSFQSDYAQQYKKIKKILPMQEPDKKLRAALKKMSLKQDIFEENSQIQRGTLEDIVRAMRESFTKNYRNIK